MYISGFLVLFNHLQPCMHCFFEYISLDMNTRDKGQSHLPGYTVIRIKQINVVTKHKV